MNFEEEMIRFEAEINRNSGYQGGPSQFVQGQGQGHGGSGQLQAKAVVASAPAIISKPSTNDEEDIFAKLSQYETDHKKEKKALKKKAKTSLMPSSVMSSTTSAATSSSSSTTVAESSTSGQSKPFAVAPASASHTPASAKIGDEVIKKAKKKNKYIRSGGGQVWEDPTLKDWDPNDFRIFCGDLGNDVTEEVLARTFGRYPSFKKAKVIRDKKSSKTKGFGFVSFSDPMDFTKAMKEMNGKYVGSRPIKLRKSNWKDRNIEIVRQKQKLKQKLGYKW